MLLRSIMVFLVVMAGLVLIQSVRNDCDWHGMENWAPWAYCVSKIGW